MDRVKYFAHTSHSLLIIMPHPYPLKMQFTVRAAVGQRGGSGSPVPPATLHQGAAPRAALRTTKAPCQHPDALPGKQHHLGLEF